MTLNAKITALLLGTAIVFGHPNAGLAQTSDTQADAATAQAEPDVEPEYEDEVVATGTYITGIHEGMDAFFRGDFETAEIEFEQEFKSLRRFQSSKENAAIEADLFTDRAAATGDAGTNLGSSVNSRGGGAPIASSGAALSTNPGLSSSFVNRRDEGQTVLTDGKITYEDFAFSRYMSGLSEIKLGKYEEARESLKTSLKWDRNNYDARMRLGLLDLMNDDYEGAADQLEKLDKIRRDCVKRSCDSEAEIGDAIRILVREITSSTAAN